MCFERAAECYMEELLVLQGQSAAADIAEAETKSGFKRLTVYAGDFFVRKDEHIYGELIPKKDYVTNKECRRLWTGF